jgi:hypothetical protein
MTNKRKRKLPQGVTEKQLQEFWNHNINPITGFRTKVVVKRKNDCEDE